jgi:formylglycine-generating enzyme required for sulfatase activity
MEREEAAMDLRRWVGMAVLLAGAASTATAQKLRIESFERDGAITFNEVAGAGEYHVERWLDPGWAHLFTVPAAGSGIVTGVVSLAEPCTIVRARAGRPDEYLMIDLTGGVDATSYPVSTLAGVPPGGWTEEHRTTKLVMRRIPAGTFTMGSPSGEVGRDDDETQHQVTLTRDFYVGVFEVTQEQWYRVMGDWPSYFNNVAYRASRPVEQVSYDDIRGSSAGAGWPGSAAVDAASFLGRLRAKTGLATLDLPTESQWEYACRAGTTTALNSGKNLTSTESDANMAEVGRYWYNGGSGFTQRGDTTVGTARAGSHVQNGWGLYDMHGNVWEWCLDWHGTYPGAVVDPAGAASGSVRVLRGGCWSTGAHFCRSGLRIGISPSYQAYYDGFRVARTLP